MQTRGVFPLHFAIVALRLPQVGGLNRCLVWAERTALSRSMLSAPIRLRGLLSQGHRIALVIRHPLALCRHCRRASPAASTQWAGGRSALGWSSCSV